MSRHLVQDLDEAYRQLLALAGQVEEMICLSLKALVNREASLAADVIARDEAIDRIEVKIEEDCLKMLALHQPVATDLRRLTMMMKINNDLERIADLACNVSERASDIIEHELFPIPGLINDIGREATEMVRQSMDAFVKLDVGLAKRVIANDDKVDAMNREIVKTLFALMEDEPQWLVPSVSCFSASRVLEQIADHAVNVAEDVIYMVEGVIVRHRHQANLLGS